MSVENVIAGDLSIESFWHSKTTLFFTGNRKVINTPGRQVSGTCKQNGHSPRAGVDGVGRVMYC